MTLFLTELECEHIDMNPPPGKTIFRDRERAKKKKKARPAVILSPRSQQERNAESARKALVRDRERREEELKRQQEAKKQMAIQQQQIAERLRQEEEEARSKESHGETHGEPRKLPSKPTRPPPPSSSGTEPSESASQLTTPASEGGTAAEDALFHHTAPSYETINTYLGPNPESDGFFGAVMSSVDAVVLCAPWPDGKLYSWNELKKPQAEMQADWDSWLSPNNWLSFIDSVYGKTVESAGVRAINAGSYNTIYEPTAASPTGDAKKWPPQLKSLGVDKLNPQCGELILPDRSYVMRITSIMPDKFGHEKWVSRGQAIVEVAHSLHMASLGIGPQIYAAVVWPWTSQTGSLAQEVVTGYGILLIQDKADYNMGTYVQELRAAFKPEGPRQIRPPPFVSKALLCGHQLVKLCYNMAVHGYIHYDIKLGNVLSYREQNVMRAIDFDDSFFKKWGFDIAGRKVCMFVSLLLLAMHTRTSTSRDFADPCLSVMGKVLLELWEESSANPESFGPGSRWINSVLIAQSPREGKYDNDHIRRIPDIGLRAGTVLRNMMWEYFQNRVSDNPPPPRVLDWSRWKTGGYVSAPRLVPQMLQYTLFFYDATAIPVRYRELLRY